MFFRLLSAVRRQRPGRGWQNRSSGRSSASAAEAHSVALPAQAQVVICGGGIMGTSVAYHLSKMGWKDIVLLEQGRLAAGSTRFCAGILSTARHLTIEQKMADYSNKLYHQLEQETGIQTEPLLSSLLRRMPDLETLEILKLVNCPETFTPDMRCIMGESPSVRGYFVLAGMNSAGLLFGGGAGRFSAEGRDSDARRCVHQAEDEQS
ncbi:pyruvate dehydrogenase phosphatase regulatory subunit, mitochondrial-like [Mustela lutreola]|uniref:pyruvate dehydrogenase phosphatase regulatory subunit, mitochondrial-like n=1 Tax=Mustela lutreola TaxID=9666 RepID=UPI0027974924|nr:pyruvate dehydrogenase phosphatase regulatory subunit, mitochondrial-like [Mustela lutreola]XP_059009685.1 pyruvate dehydrogenase phosphatase regulatory subunit, mitochondrial-like [Mustela lutreola]